MPSPNNLTQESEQTDSRLARVRVSLPLVLTTLEGGGSANEIMPVRFSKQEAESKLGSKVRSRIDIDGIPAGAAGRVVQLDEIERHGFDLIVEWSRLVQGRRQHNWFNRDDFEECLIEVNEEAVTNA